MPNSKKSRKNPPPRGENNGASKRKMNTFAKLSTSGGKPSTTGNGIGNNAGNDGKQSKPSQRQQKNQRPVIPFGTRDRVLLIGEGDFSFARSLVTQHRCKNVLATCYDSKDTLFDKYPQAEGHIQDILSRSKKGQPEKQDDSSVKQETNDQKKKGPNVLYSVDARKLGLQTGGGKDVRTGFARREPKLPAWRLSKQNANADAQASKGGPWDLICFNFPHVGGLSTDVNRQVRANQELLVAFFKACVPLLSVPTKIGDGEDEDDWEFSESSDEDEDEEEGGLNAEGGSLKSKFRSEPGHILVTLFEAEPYTLWNIKDLARHAGLKVVTSFKFPWASYENYSHARTLGEVEGKNGGRGGWKGEDREARMYVFEVKQEERPRKPQPPKADSAKKNKRSRKESESDDSE